MTADRKKLLKKLTGVPLYKGLTNWGEYNAYKRIDREHIMDLWDEIFDLDDKSKEELEAKYAEWWEVEPRLYEGVDELVIYIEAMTGISDESMLIYTEVKEIKVRYKQQEDVIQAKIDEMNEEKEKM